MYREKTDYLHEHKKKRSLIHERIQFFDDSFNERFPLNFLFAPLRDAPADVVVAVVVVVDGFFS